MATRTLFLVATAVFWNAVGYYAVRCPVQAACPPMPTVPAVGSQDKRLVSRDEVASHSTPRDCWMIIEDRVYSVGPFVDIHPGDTDLMVKYCGRDGSEKFAAKDSGKEKGKPHSERANELLAEYLVGRLAKQ